MTEGLLPCCNETCPDFSAAFGDCRFRVAYLPRCRRAYAAGAGEWVSGFEIKNADGSDIDYEKLGQKYKDQLIYCDIDGFYIGEDGQLILMDDCGSYVWVERKDYQIRLLPDKPEGKP
jgi:hypothetical protein